MLYNNNETVVNINNDWSQMDNKYGIIKTVKDTDNND